MDFQTSTLIVYHRAGGKSLDYPPCTLLTVKWAIDKGAKAIEYDVILATDKNGKDHIVMFEPKLINETGLDIDNLVWEDIKDINAGNEKFGKLPLTPLNEVLETSEGKIAQQIQLKGDGNPKLIPALLDAVKNSTNFILTAFDRDVIKVIKEHDKKIRVGWLVKPAQEKGSEGTVDLTAVVRANPDAFPEYTDEEINTIIKEAKENLVDVILLCGPRIKSKEIVNKVHSEGMEIGAWGVGMDLDLARRLIALGLDRFTLDNPEQL